MNVKHVLEELKQLPPATQVALVILALVLVLLLVLLLAFVPTVGASILAFLIALKTLTTR